MNRTKSDPTKVKRTFNDPVLSVRLSPASINKLIMDFEDPLKEEHLWCNLTHVVYDGLVYTDKGGVEVGTLSFAKKTDVMLQPGVYVPWLQELHAAYPMLQIVWSLPPVLESTTKTLQSIVNEYGWTHIMKNVYNVNLNGASLPMDGVEFNFLCSPVFDREFIDNILFL